MKKKTKYSAKIGADKLIETWRSESEKEKALYASVTNVIHGKIGELKKKPSLIRLSCRASFCFAKEHWANPFRFSTYPAEYNGIKIEYNADVDGVIVE